jgi:ribosomal protein L40E
MSQSKSEPKPERICRECGAPNDPDASECWLCHRRDWRSDATSPPAKADVSAGGDPTRRRIAIAIVVGTAVILGLGMILDIWERSDFWGFGLVLATLVIPVGLMIWTRVRKRPAQSPSMTNRELAAAGTTIAAGVILLTWLFQAAASESISTILVVLVFLAMPAGLITAAKVRRRRREGRPMTRLQVTASVIFLTVLLPPLLLMSLVIAFALICLAAGQMNSL